MPDASFYRLGTLGAELPLSGCDCDLKSTSDSYRKDIRLPSSYLKSYVSATPTLRWQLHWSYLHAKSRDVFDGGYSRDTLWTLYASEQEMSFLVPTAHGTDAYFVRFSTGTWNQTLIRRGVDWEVYDVTVELQQSQPGPLAMNYSAVILREPLLSLYYRMDASSGLVEVDRSSGGNNGTYNGTVGYNAAGALTGDPDKAIGFDGSTTYLSSNIILTLASQPFTIEAWVKPAAYPSLGLLWSIFGVYGGSFASGNLAMMYLSHFGGVGGSFWATAYETSAIPIGSYSHAMWSYDGANTSLFVNGVLGASGANGPFTGNVVSVQIGQIGATATYYFDGSIDEVAYYRGALSASDAVRHYVAGRVNLPGA